MQDAHKSTDLAPDERVAVERLLGKTDQHPIWEVILDNMKDVPPEEFGKLPKDGASEDDHHLCSHPQT